MAETFVLLDARKLDWNIHGAGAGSSERHNMGWTTIAEKCWQ
jgi:hypothetical protein